MNHYLDKKYLPISESLKPRLRSIVKEKKLHHLMLICDGNRRWARELGFHPSDGHRRSFEYLSEQIILDLMDLDISTITLWCYSTYNMNREESEIRVFMGCIEVLIEKIFFIAQKRKIHVTHLGRKDRMSNSLRMKTINVENHTRENDRFYLNLAMDYSGHDETIRAFKKILLKKTKPNDLRSETIENELDTANLPYPELDLVIRPTGAKRLSGIMFWQSVYAELYFSDLLYPQFDGSVLEKAILDFETRDRRFGR